MFKKFLITTAILSSANVAFAAAPYIGGGVGLNDTKMTATYAYSDTTYEAHGTRPNFNIFGGYGGLINRSIYLGAEVFANTTKGDINAYTSPAVIVQYSTRDTYGASIIPGIMLSNSTMLYGRVGVVRGDFDVDTLTAFGEKDHYESATGAQAGAGLQTHLNDHFDARAEYVHSSYESFTLQDIKMTPTSNQFNIGLVYRFL